MSNGGKFALWGGRSSQRLAPLLGEASRFDIVVLQAGSYGCNPLDMNVDFDELCESYIHHGRCVEAPREIKYTEDSCEVLLKPGLKILVSQDEKERGVLVFSIKVMVFENLENLSKLRELKKELKWKVGRFYDECRVAIWEEAEL